MIPPHPAASMYSQCHYFLHFLHTALHTLFPGLKAILILFFFGQGEMCFKGTNLEILYPTATKVTQMDSSCL
ncbi:hypothetical protein BDZ91DRAFT_135616 [Kalaharituber pfeilii]|nr:hypothetical protein BDZ91DRAFT_135616 [Kalaharituber pfeilii]